MAIIGSLFAALGRFAGKLLNAVLGWATLLLFGKVSGSKQTILLLVALGSLVWVVTLLGIVIPDIGTFLLAFVPVPDFIDETWVRLAMVGLAIVIPLVIGAAAIFLTEAERRPTGRGLLIGLLRGYPFTLVLALTIIVLGGVALARKLRSLSKRWDDAHVPVIGRQQLGERRRRLAQHGDPLGHQQVAERVRFAGGEVRHHDEPAAGDQAAPDLPHREVERGRVEPRPDVPRAQAVGGTGGVHQRDHVAVRDDHALRPARRAGRVDHVGRVARTALLQFGGTGLLIVVGVGLETVKQIESQLQQRNYEGFLR